MSEWEMLSTAWQSPEGGQFFFLGEDSLLVSYLHYPSWFPLTGEVLVPHWASAPAHAASVPLWSVFSLPIPAHVPHL